MSTPFSLPVREQPLILATRNPGKVRELADALRRFGFDVRPLPDDFPEIEETGTTFEQNALLKAHAVADTLGLPALADDSGLEVDALNGAPGVYSARYGLDIPALPGENDDARNNRKLLADRPLSLLHGPGAAGQTGSDGTRRMGRSYCRRPFGRKRLRI